MLGLIGLYLCLKVRIEKTIGPSALVSLHIPFFYFYCSSTELSKNLKQSYMEVAENKQLNEVLLPF